MNVALIFQLFIGNLCSLEITMYVSFLNIRTLIKGYTVHKTSSDLINRSPVIFIVDFLVLSIYMFLQVICFVLMS